MKPIVALNSATQASAFCEEARQMLLHAGFELRCNPGIRPTPDQLKEMVAGAYAIVAGTEKYTADVLEAADQLKVIIRFGVGTDNLDLAALREKGVQVGVITNYNAVAEFALTLILSAMKNLPRFDTAARDGKWSRFPMRELTGKTVGLVGFGRIGQRLAELLQGFGTEILAYDPYMNTKAAEERKVQPVSMEELLARADIVSLHLPATAETHHLINAQTISRMKDGAYLINTARGSLVDEAALYDALVSGKLSGAALDVFEKEPVTADNPLFGLPNIVVAPHVSALSYETNYNGSLICAESIIRVLQGEAPLYPLW